MGIETATAKAWRWVFPVVAVGDSKQRLKVSLGSRRVAAFVILPLYELENSEVRLQEMLATETTCN